MKQISRPQYHATGTVMMGKPENPLACVGADFHVLGTEKLFVADLSVCPKTPWYVDLIFTSILLYLAFFTLTFHDIMRFEM